MSEYVILYRRNGSYLDALLNQQRMTLKYVPKLSTIVIKDADYNLIKLLKDASTSSNHPAGRVLFANISGRADTDSQLTWDGSDLIQDSFPVFHSGKLSFTVSNNGHTAVYSLSSDGILTVSIDGEIKKEYQN